MNSPENFDRNSGEKEKYTHDYSDDFVRFLLSRTAETEAAFFLPHLRSNMNLLDCGCGPGAITIDFSKIVAPGIVTGIDIEESQLKIAQKQANNAGINNVAFRSADIYELPFNIDSFDAAFAHTTLQHLSDPVKALREIYRVLKLGALIGVRDDDVGSLIFAPTSSIMEEGVKIFEKVWKHNGGDPHFGRLHRQSLREAGFVKIESFATCLCCGTPEAAKEQSKFIIAMASAPNFRKQAIAMNLCDKQMLDDLINEWSKWGKHPDAFFAVTFCETVGWVK